MDIRDSRTNEERTSSLMWGIGLVLVGSVVLLQYLDVMPFTVWTHWWPFIIILVGLGQLIACRSAKGVGDGVSTMLIGGWCFIATNHVLGLTWRNSWPLALVAAGTGMVVRSLASWIMDRGDGTRAGNGHVSGCLCAECTGEVKRNG